MTPRNIDLLVLTKRDSMNQIELQKEIENIKSTDFGNDDFLNIDLKK